MIRTRSSLALDRFAAILVLTGLAAIPATAMADTTGSNLSVRVGVSQGCTMAVTSLDFGTVDTTLVTQVDVDSTVTVNCNIGVPFYVRMSDGDNPVSAGGQRRMKSPAGDFMTYEIYKNLLRTQRWGTGTAYKAGLITPNEPYDMEVYGRLTGISPATPPGDYTDLIAVELTF